MVAIIWPGSWQVKLLCPTSEYLAQFWLQLLISACKQWEALANGSSIWVPATNVKGLRYVPSSWLDLWPDSSHCDRSVTEPANDILSLSLWRPLVVEINGKEKQASLRSYCCCLLNVENVQKTDFSFPSKFLIAFIS